MEDNNIACRVTSLQFYVSSIILDLLEQFILKRNIKVGFSQKCLHSWEKVQKLQNSLADSPMVSFPKTLSRVTTNEFGTENARSPACREKPNINIYKKWGKLTKTPWEV